MKDTYLPSEYRKPTLHRIKIGDEAFDVLGEIRKKLRLWDREAVILYLIDEYKKRSEEPKKD